MIVAVEIGFDVALFAVAVVVLVESSLVCQLMMFAVDCWVLQVCV